MSTNEAFLKYVLDIDENIILNSNDEITLLQHLEILKSKDISIPYLNEDIARLILKINPKNEHIITKFKELNLDDL